MRHTLGIADQVQDIIFQSTHPVRGATLGGWACDGGTVISIHAPRAGCDFGLRRRTATSRTISIHAPRAGCDVTDESETGGLYNFNPRTPCGVRLRRSASRRGERFISIHAPRAGCDCRRIRFSDTTKHFNPRTPCGVRRQTCTTWFAPIFATLPNQMYVCLHYTCFTTLFQPKTWFSAVFQRCEAPRESMSAPASHRVKASAAPPAHRSAWRRYAQRGSDSYSQDCKSAGCPSPG